MSQDKTRHLFTQFSARVQEDIERDRANEEGKDAAETRLKEAWGQRRKNRKLAAAFNRAGVVDTLDLDTLIESEQPEGEDDFWALHEAVTGVMEDVQFGLPGIAPDKTIGAGDLQILSEFDWGIFNEDPRYGPYLDKWKGYVLSIAYEIYDEESVQAGEAKERGWEDEGTTYDSVAEVADNLDNRGPWEWSSSGTPSDGDWLTTTDDESDYKTGETKRYSAFIKRGDGQPMSPREMKFLDDSLKASSWRDLPDGILGSESDWEDDEEHPLALLGEGKINEEMFTVSRVGAVGDAAKHAGDTVTLTGKKRKTIGGGGEMIQVKPLSGGKPFFVSPQSLRNLSTGSSYRESSSRTSEATESMWQRFSSAYKAIRSRNPKGAKRIVDDIVKVMGKPENEHLTFPELKAWFLDPANDAKARLVMAGALFNSPVKEEAGKRPTQAAKFREGDTVEMRRGGSGDFTVLGVVTQGARWIPGDGYQYQVRSIKDYAGKMEVGYVRRFREDDLRLPADSQKESKVNEELKLGLRDRKVLQAFADGKAAEGQKLTTDGKTLTGTWMGGGGLATRNKDGMVSFGDTGGRSQDVINRALRKIVPKNFVAESSGPSRESVQSTKQTKDLFLGATIKEGRSFHVVQTLGNVNEGGAYLLRARSGELLLGYGKHFKVTEGAVGKAQLGIMQALENRADGEGVELSDIARSSALRGVHFTKIQSGAAALAQKGMVKYDGVSTVTKITSGGGGPRNESTVAVIRTNEASLPKGIRSRLRGVSTFQVHESGKWQSVKPQVSEGAANTNVVPRLIEQRGKDCPVRWESEGKTYTWSPRAKMLVVESQINEFAAAIAAAAPAIGTALATAARGLGAAGATVAKTAGPALSSFLQGAGAAGKRMLPWLASGASMTAAAVGDGVKFVGDMGGKAVEFLFDKDGNMTSATEDGKPVAESRIRVRVKKVRSRKNEGQVTVEEGDFGTFILTHEDGQDVLIQTDWDYPGVASNLGWSPKHASDELGKDCPSGCGSTDGTITCPDCGTTAGDYIGDAYEFLRDHEGESFEDPGYFDVD